MGGAPSQTEVIDKIGRPIGASAVSNGVAITADAVIGDNEHCVAVFSIARTDGMPIEGVDTILDKSFTTVFTGAQLFRVGDTKVGPEYCFYDADPSDNSVQCIVKMTSFIGGDSFIGKIMHDRTRRFGDGRNDGRRQNHSPVPPDGHRRILGHELPAQLRGRID